MNTSIAPRIVLQLIFGFVFLLCALLMVGAFMLDSLLAGTILAAVSGFMFMLGVRAGTDLDLFFARPDNPLVTATLYNRFQAWKCKRFGHLTHGAHYGMRQATCRRCGKKLPAAISSVPEWNYPNPEYLSRVDQRNTRV